MSRAVRWLLLLIASLALIEPAAAVAAEAAMSVEVPPGQYRSLRLRNLPKDAILAVAVQTPDKLATSLVSELDYRRYPKPEDPVFVGTTAREVYDVTGAGDTVIATLAAALAAGATMLEAANLANHAAGIVVGKVGTATASAAELLATFQ